MGVAGETERDEVWCEDGSRSGVRGVSLGEALRGGGGSKL